MQMNKFIWLGMALSLLLPGCSSPPPPQDGSGSYVEAVIIAPGEIKGGSDAVWRVNINGFNGPFKIHWDFGGGALANEHTFTDELSPNLLKVQMLNDTAAEKRYIATVTVTDKTGAVDSREYSYGVAVPGNRAPVIDNALVSNDRVLVSTTDADGDTITVTVLDEFGNRIGTQTGNVTEFPINPLLGFWLDREIVLTVSASDGEDGTDTTELSYLPQKVTLAKDTLYAVATSSQGSVVDDPLTSGPGSGVLVVVATGELAWPFQFLNGVGITCEDGSDYVRGTFDAGVPDGVPDADGVDVIDGIWAQMAPEGLELLADDLIGGNRRSDVGGGRGRLDFGILPQGGSDLRGASGVLFSFEIGFTEPGEYLLGFQAANTVSRTYYQDELKNNEYFWGTISNVGIPNTITVE
jgi:hypothetical protein